MFTYRKNGFDVCGMRNSTFMLPDAELDTLAQQYRFEDGRPGNIGKPIENYKIGTEYASGGAAGAYLAIDMQNAILIFFGSHLMLSPAQGLRSKLYRFVRAELFDPSDIENIYAELNDLYDYKLTY